MGKVRIQMCNCSFPVTVPTCGPFRRCAVSTVLREVQEKVWARCKGQMALAVFYCSVGECVQRVFPHTHFLCGVFAHEVLATRFVARNNG
jgi:hypothetical protein